MSSCQTGIIPLWSTSGERMKGLDVGYGVLCHRFDMRRAGQHQQFNWRGRRSWGQELYQPQAEFLSAITAFGQPW
jgi:hypothetical protein